jgi:hypothetical protein
MISATSAKLSRIRAHISPNLRHTKRVSEHGAI